MWFKKFKREFYKKIPYLFFSLLLLCAFAFIIFYFSKTFISKHNFFISPLARNKNTNNIANIKEGSIEDSLYNQRFQALLIRNSISFLKVDVASDSSYIIFLKDNGEVHMDSKKNLQPQISSLQLILSRLTIEGKKFKKLDLRYELPIIEF